MSSASSAIRSQRSWATASVGVWCEELGGVGRFSRLAIPLVRALWRVRGGGDEPAALVRQIDVSLGEEPQQLAVPAGRHRAQLTVPPRLTGPTMRRVDLLVGRPLPSTGSAQPASGHIDKRPGRRDELLSEQEPESLAPSIAQRRGRRVAFRPRQQPVELATAAANLQAAELDLTVAHRDRGVRCLVWIDPDHDIHDVPPESMSGIAVGTPTCGSSCSFLSRATPRQDPDRVALRS